MTLLLLITLSIVYHPTWARAQPIDQNEWQLRMAYQPSDAMLERESKGFVFIYDGLSDHQVERILDARFERIDHMMFTRVRLTDASTGEVNIAEDGCD